MLKIRKLHDDPCACVAALCNKCYNTNKIELTDGTNRRRHVPRVGHDDGQVSMNKHIEIVADR